MVRCRIAIIASLCGLPLAVLSAPATTRQRFEFRKVLMGVECRLVLYAPDAPRAREAGAAAFDRIAALDAVMSDYRPDSELMRLCAVGHHAPTKVSPDLFTVLRTALDIAQASDGAFDITVGPFVRLWRQARQTRQLPTPSELADARTKVGWQKICLDPEKRTVRLAVAGMQWDLGGIAKGYAVDCALQVLQRFGVAQAMVEFGGDIRLGDPPPHRAGWRIRLPEGAQPAVMELARCAVSTSGTTEQFVDINGQRYAHIIDPRTGLGLTRLTVATVVADCGLLSDPLATAVCVLGREKGEQLVRRYNARIVFFRQAP